MSKCSLNTQIYCAFSPLDTQTDNALLSACVTLDYYPSYKKRLKLCNDTHKLFTSVFLPSVFSGCLFSVKYGFHISRWIKGKIIDLINCSFLHVFFCAGSEIKRTNLTSTQTHNCRVQWYGKLIRAQGVCSELWHASSSISGYLDWWCNEFNIMYKFQLEIEDCWSVSMCSSCQLKYLRCT